MVYFLKKYININTSHSKPDYDSVCDLFKTQSKKDNLDCEVLKLSSGLPVIIISLIGSEPKFKSIALNHHMDVVHAGDINLYKHNPFYAVKNNDIIYGRGTQDCKGLGVAQYFALKKLKESNIKNKRTINLLIVPDEELGGFNGTKFFVKTKKFLDLNIGFLLDEGLPSGNDNSILIKVSERSVLQIKLTCQGEQSHSSKLESFNAIYELANFISNFSKLQEKEQINRKDISSGLLNSYQITSFISGDFNSINTIPDKAQAIIDIRISPKVNFYNIKRYLDSLISKYPTISYEILACEKNKSFFKSDNLLKAIFKTLNIFKLNSVNYYAQESSDARFYSKLGIQVLGITPFTCKSNIHGIDESIRVSDLNLARDFFYKFLINFCC